MYILEEDYIILKFVRVYIAKVVYYVKGYTCKYCKSGILKAVDVYITTG